MRAQVETSRGCNSHNTASGEFYRKIYFLTSVQEIRPLFAATAYRSQLVMLSAARAEPRDASASRNIPRMPDSHQTAAGSSTEKSVSRVPGLCRGIFDRGPISICRPRIPRQVQQISNRYPYKQISAFGSSYFQPCQWLMVDSCKLEKRLSPRKWRLPSILRAYFLKVIIISCPFLNWLPDMAYITGIL
jgi:hypothetical protein